MNDHFGTPTKSKVFFAVGLTILSLVYFLSGIPGANQVSVLKSLRGVFLFVGWKTEWSMFAPGPRRTFPVSLTLRTWSPSLTHFEDHPIFDIYNFQDAALFKGVDQTHLALFYLRLWSEGVRSPNCERMVDEWVRHYESTSGHKVAKAEAYWEEIRIPEISQSYTKFDQVPYLNRKSVKKFEKYYGP